MKWKDIKGFEGFYQVSSCGLVRSLDRYVDRSGRKMLLRGKVLAQNIGTTGYLAIMLYKGSKGHPSKVHRLVAKTFIGESGLYVNHKDLNKLNNKVENLEYVTQLENVRHAISHGAVSSGNFKKGSLHRGYRITVEQKMEIISMKQVGYSGSYIAKKYSIAYGTVFNIITKFKKTGLVD